QAAGGERVRAGGQLRGGGAVRAQRLVDGQHLGVRQRGQLGGPQEVLRELRVAVLGRDLGLVLQCGRGDPDVVQADLAAADRVQGQFLERLAGERRHRWDSTSSGSADGRWQPRSMATRPTTAVWYLASTASSVYGLRTGTGVAPLACRPALMPIMRYRSAVMTGAMLYSSRLASGDRSRRWISAVPL